MGRSFKKESNLIPIYNIILGNGHIQRLDHFDFCNMILIPDDVEEEYIKFKIEYKNFILETKAKIVVINNSKFIDYWEGSITIDIKDKVRIKNLLRPLKNVSVHGGWTKASDKKLVFECNYDFDIFIINNTINTTSEKNDKISFKTKEWVLQELMSVIDSVY
jgi:hypothetical protein